MALMQESEHGGNIYEASRLYGKKAKKILDFSANINPLGPPPELKKILKSVVKDVAGYPDPDCSELKQAIAQYMSVDPCNVITGNGASEIIYLLLEVTRPGNILIPVPSFSEYANAARRYGIEINFHVLKEYENFRFFVNEDFLKKAEQSAAVFLCNPNNPTSTLIKPQDISKILEYTAAKGITVIIDETFIELTENGESNSSVKLIGQYENLFIIRAFTKILSIPGIRLGYGIGNKKLVRKMWEKKLPWSVNSFAQAVGNMLGNIEEYVKKTQQWLETEKEWLYDRLCSIDGIKPYRPDTNFILSRIVKENMDGSALKEKMINKGILIRDASNFESLDSSFFRTAVKDRESNKKLVSALKRSLSGNRFFT
jgi:threonine-phosphate decarboxylase